jgi:3-phenylpropionate/trans-cinnamate dioxygenase ferredoxin reductase subunit
MQSYPYLIIGGGMTADAAVKGIRLSDASSRIGLIGEELDPPYSRPPLSKGLWTDLKLDEIWRPTRGRQVEMHLGRRAVQLDPARRLVRDQKGELYRYDKLLLAVGGQPRRLPGDDTNVIYYRTLADYRRARVLADARGEICIVGAGLIGTELAAVMVKRGARTTLLSTGAWPCASLLPAPLGKALGEYLQKLGVRLEVSVRVQSVQRIPGGHELQLLGGRRLHSPQVAAGIGLVPNTELAAQAGARVTPAGIVVDATLQTSVADLWAAGDCTVHHCPALDRPVQSQHEEHANFSGLAAGRAMAGKPTPYAALPYFYSTVGERGYEGVGLIDTQLDHEAATPGIYGYFDGGRLVGVLYWNQPADIERATALIEAGTAPAAALAALAR